MLAGGVARCQNDELNTICRRVGGERVRGQGVIEDEKHHCGVVIMLTSYTTSQRPLKLTHWVYVRTVTL